jgi:hypothetical protein
MPRFVCSILLGFFLMGLGARLWAAPIGFQGNPIQFPYATQSRGIGFQGQFYNPNRFVVDPAVSGPGFQPTRGAFPLDPGTQFPTFDPRFDPTPAGFTPLRRF